MNCSNIAPHLAPYPFGEIPAEARDEVEAHLLDCPDCLADFLALNCAVPKRRGPDTHQGPT